MENVQNLRSGKMLEEHSPQTTEKTSDVSWKNLHTSSKQTLQFLNLREKAENGLNQAQFPVMDGLWHGDSSMLNIGECPNVVKESRLSWILEDNVPQKYYLSARACQGILVRASRRGKPLPELLKQALLDLIEWWNPGTISQVMQKVNEQEGLEEKGTGRVLESDHRETSTRCTEPAAYVLKIRSGCEGGGKGALVQTELSATISTLQDQTLFQPVVYDARGNGDGKIVPTITGDHENRITDYTAIAIERKTFNEQSFSHYKESDKCSTLKAKAGNIGNGSECLAVEKTSIAVDGYNGAVTGEKAASLTCKNDGSHSGPLVAEKTICWIVRRLTPVECERLQGFPDVWTDIGEWVDENGKKHKPADSPRYKALGNSIALPQWYWIFQKMKPYIGENPTLGSLFDGIGGFPLVFESTYGDGTAIWGSEIEPFCVAVTKKHFPED